MEIRESLGPKAECDIEIRSVESGVSQFEMRAAEEALCSMRITMVYQATVVPSRIAMSCTAFAAALLKCLDTFRTSASILNLGIPLLYFLRPTPQCNKLSPRSSRWTSNALAACWSSVRRIQVL